MFRVSESDLRLGHDCGRGRAFALALLIGSAGACTREALPDICPNVDVGELVISELRGDQDGQESFGHYVEIYNAAGKTVDLQGLYLRLRSSGGSVLALVVRESIELGAGDYAVLGPGLPEDKNSWIDYGVGWDISGGDPSDNRYPRDLMRYRSAFVELVACDVLIDEVFYDTDALPEAGTAACGDADTPPSAAQNDHITVDLDEGCWCRDDQDIGGQPLNGIGLPGSPGGANRCP